MKINNKNIKISKKTFLRKPSKVMKLNRLGSFHQTRLSFCRQLVNQLKDNNWIFRVPEWNIDKNGIGNAIISSNDGENTYCLVVFCHPINDHDRSDRVIAEKWDMTFSLFLGEPTQTEIDYMSENLKVQEAGHHSSKQMTLSRANKSVRVFNNILSSLSKGKQPNKTLINDIGYLVRTTAVYGNGKFGIGDFDNISKNSFLKKPFQAEMLTVYLIRFFSIKLINFLAKMKGGTASVKLSDEISKHIGVGNATGLGMAPFLINHPELLHKWINTRETAISRVYEIEKIDTNQQNEIVNLLQRALNYTNQWKVDDQNQSTRIKNLQLDLKKIIDDPTTKILLSDTYPLKNIFDFFVDQISLEANGEYRLKLASTTAGYEASMDNSNTAYRIFGSRFGGTGKYVAIWSDGANENTRFYPTLTTFYKMVGMRTTSPYSVLDVNGVIANRAADADPNFTVAAVGMSTIEGGSLQFTQGFGGTSAAGDTVVFRYNAVSWKSWSLDYTFTAANAGLVKGTIGGYNNGGGGGSNGFVKNDTGCTVVATNSGQNVIVTFTANFGIHPMCDMRYSQGGGDGAPRADRASLTFNS